MAGFDKLLRDFMSLQRADFNTAKKRFRALPLLKIKLNLRTIFKDLNITDFSLFAIFSQNLLRFFFPKEVSWAK